MNKWVRRFLYFIGTVVGLILIILLLLQTPGGKNLVRKKLQAYISKKTNTEFLIGSIDYRLPTWVELNGVLMRDQAKDTLIFGQRIRADVAMIQLLSAKYQVEKIELENMYVNLVKNESDSVFNFQFVINAFQSKSENTNKSDTAMIDLSLKQLILKDVRFNLLDSKSGSFTKMSVKEFELRVNNLDINKLSFDIEKLYTDQLNFQLIVQKNVLDTSKTRTAAVWPTINADSVIIKNSFILFDDQVSKTKSTNSISELELLGFNNLDSRKLLTGKTIRISNSAIGFDHQPEAGPSEEVIIKRDSAIVIDELGFVVNEFDLLNNKVVYNNNTLPVKINGIDYAHLAIEGLRLKALNTSYRNQVFQSTISGFSFRDKSGFRLDSLSGYVRLDSGKIELKDLYAKTPNSVIQASATVYPLSFTNQRSAPANLPQNSIVITNTILSKKDLDLLAESITRTYRTQLDALGDLLVNADIKGDARRLFVRHLDARSVSGKPFRVELSGTATNISDERYLQYDFNIRNFTATKSLFEPFTKGSPTPVNWPQLISARGRLAGSLNRINTNLQLNTSFGNAVVKGSLANFSDPAHLQYDLDIQTQRMETGKWIFDEKNLGPISGSIKLKGKNGFDIKKSSINTTASIASIRIGEFIFNNIRGTISLINGLANFNVAINDNKVVATAIGKANLKTEYPAVDASLNVQHADMKALGLTQKDLILSTLADIDLENSSPQHLDAYLRLDSTTIKTATQEVFSDSAIVSAFVRNDSTIIEMVSDLADANLASTLNYEELPLMLSEVLSYYYKTSGQPVRPAAQGTVVAYISLKPSAYLQEITSGLSFKNAQLNAEITNTNRDSAVKGNLVAEQLELKTNKITNLEASFSGTKDTLLMVMRADTVKAGNILLYHATAKAGVANNNFSADISSTDAKDKPQYAVAFTITQDPDKSAYTFRLKNGLMLNYDNWAVNEENHVHIQGSSFNIHALEFNNNKQRIFLNSITHEMDVPVTVNVSDFKLSTFTAALNKDSLLLEGLLNAAFTVSDFKQPLPSVEGTFKLDSLIYQRTLVGNLDLKASTQAGQVSISGKMDGNGNNVDINGVYNENNIDLTLNLNPLSLSSLQPFTQGNLVRSSGTITGPLKITGPVTNPAWNGSLILNNVNTTVAAFGTYLKADNQTIVLEYPSIKFNNFTVQDSTGNPLKINGTITQDSDKTFISDLALTAKNFTAINNSATDNNFLYGKAIAELDAMLKGDILFPELSGNVTVKDGTTLTYVQQAIPASLKERAKIMEFIDMDTIANLQVKNNRLPVEEEKKQTRTAGTLQYNLNVEVEPEAEFSIILDPATRDELKVQGSGQINTVVNPNGTVSVAGTYDLKSGSYLFNYGPIQKKFDLQAGSSITMSGDPLNAIVNATAIYEISTPAIDLVSNEIGGSIAAENNIYRRKVPFQVLLKITGVVSAPQLDFDIVIKEKAAGVSYEIANTVNNKLDQLRTDPSAMNKQVFGLLAFNRFIPDESADFFGGNGLVRSGLSSNVSVTSYLNAAMEQIASDMIKGVDLDLSINEVNDDPSAERTDLNVSLARSFMDDRLNISFGKSITIAGEDVTDKTGSNSSMQFLPDFTATYKLSRDGKYMMRAYRRNQYEAVLDGYFIESGLAFSLSIEYGKLSELLKRKKK